MKCPTCGAENEASNRFCDQCGSRLEPSGASSPAQEAAASQPTAAGPTCPSCGATVLPGEAFVYVVLGAYLWLVAYELRLLETVASH